MTNLAALLDTWQQWSAQNVISRTSGRTPDEKPNPSALDALRDSHELVELLTGWQWQAMYAARHGGASWEQIAATLRTTAEHARGQFEAVIDSQERTLSTDTSAYRDVL